MTHTPLPRKRLSIKSSADVRISDRGIAYADLYSSRDVTGIIPSFDNSSLPDLAAIPPGVIVYNTDLASLQLSTLSAWITISAGGSASGTTSGALLGSQLPMGLPSDSSLADGAIALTSGMSVTEAIDLLNEALLGGVPPSGLNTTGAQLNDTTRWDGLNYVPNSSLKADGVDVFVQNRLTISGSFVVSSGISAPPVFSGSAGTTGEVRWDDDFLYLKTAVGWARLPLNYF